MLQMIEKPPKNWLKLTCMGCIFAPCLLGIFTYGFLKYRVNVAGDELPTEVAKLRRMGVATEPEDLVTKPPVPDNQNGAQLYTLVNAEMRSVYDKTKTSPYKNVLSNYYYMESGHPDDKMLATEEMKPYSGAFKSMEAATARPFCDFHRDFSQGPNLLFPELADMKSMVKLLAGKAKLQWQAGDLKGALHSIEMQLTIAKHCGNKYSLIEDLVCIAMQAISFVTLDQYLETIKNNQPMLAETRQMLERSQIKLDIRKGMYGEIVMGRIGIRELKNWNGYADDPENGQRSNPLERALDKATLGDPSVKRMFEAKFVKMWREVFERLPKDPEDYMGFKRVFDDLDVKISADNSFENKINQLMFPIFSGTGPAAGQFEARQRLALLAVRLLQDRAKGLPASIKEYGKLAQDPLSGKPMGYVRKGKGFKIWSVGQDLKDQGGTKYISGGTLNRDVTDLVLGYDIGLPRAPFKKAIRTGSAPAGFAGGPPPAAAPRAIR